MRLIALFFALVAFSAGAQIIPGQDGRYYGQIQGYDIKRPLVAQTDAVPLKIALKAIAGFNGTLASGQYLAPDGTVAAPSYSFSSYTGKGMYSGAAGTLDFAVAGANVLSLAATTATLTDPNILAWWKLHSSAAGGLGFGSGHQIVWGSSATNIGTSGAAPTGDTNLSRVSAGVIGVGTGAAGSVAGTIQAANHSQTGANGQVLAMQSLSELTTIAAAATTDTTIQMPAGAVVLAVSVRVTTVIPTAATFTVGDSGSAARFSTAAVSTAANTTDAGTKAGAYYNAGALAIRITPNLTPADTTGRVRVTIHYYSVTPPTS